MAKNVKYLRSLDNTQPFMEKIAVAANQTIVVGDLLVVSSGKAAKAGAAPTLVLGIAQEAITTGASPTDADAIMVLVLNSKSVVRLVYTGVTKTSLTTAELFGAAAYDIKAAQTVDLDDTTGGFLLPVAFNNTAKTVDAVIKASVLWNA